MDLLLEHVSRWQYLGVMVRDQQALTRLRDFLRFLHVPALTKFTVIFDDHLSEHCEGDPRVFMGGAPLLSTVYLQDALLSELQVPMHNVSALSLKAGLRRLPSAIEFDIPQLRHLNIDGLNFPRLRSDLTAPNLQSLLLTNVRDEDFEAGHPCFPSVRSLSFAQPSMIRDDSFSALAADFPAVQSLRWECCDDLTTRLFLNRLMTHTNHWPQLKSITMRNCGYHIPLLKNMLSSRSHAGRPI